MSKEQFPLTRQLGLEVHEQMRQGRREAVCHNVRAADLEKLLEAAPVVYSKRSPAIGSPYSTMWTSYENNKGALSFAPLGETARLVGIQPIKKDTAESLLRELVKAEAEAPRFKTHNPEDAHKFPRQVIDIVERARKLLEGK